MNENVQENLETVVESVSHNDGVSGNVVAYSGNGGSSVSSGDSGQAEPFDVSGNEYITPVTESGNIAGDIDVYSEYSGTGEDVQYLAGISQGINALNGTVTLLFLFLLMAWAEKMINVVIVRRFSEKKR